MPSHAARIVTSPLAALLLAGLASCAADGDDAGPAGATQASGASQGGNAQTAGASGGAFAGGAGKANAGGNSSGGDATGGISTGGASAGGAAAGGAAGAATGGAAGGIAAGGGAAGGSAQGGASSGGAGGGATAASACEGRLAPAEPVGATHVVGNGDAASCTEQALRDAAAAVSAEGSGTITFSCGGAHTIALTQAIALSSSKTGTVIIDGGGEITLSGGGATRVLDLANYTRLVVQRLTLKDGFVAMAEPPVENKPADSGAAIRHPWYGSLRVIDCVFENNRCEGREGEIGGGAIFAGGLDEIVISGSRFVGNSASNGGALLNRGSTLTIVDSEFRDNGALSQGDGQFGNGGGVYIDGMNYDMPGDLRVCGALFANNTAMTHGSGMFAYFYEGSASHISKTTFDGNRFGVEGSGAGTLYHEAVKLTLTESTFSNNSGAEHAGAIFIGQKSVVEATNCTFAGNRVKGNGAAIFDGAAEATFAHCTFAGNDADYGPAIFKGQSAKVSLKSCLFANNTTPNQYSATSCHEAMTDLGGNVQWPATKQSGKPDQPCVEGITFADPLLSPLADNGGPTLTMALSPGSAALGVATSCPPTDQRGQPRHDPCDAGAFELSP